MVGGLDRNVLGHSLMQWCQLSRQTLTVANWQKLLCQKTSTNHNASVQFNSYKYNANKPSQGMQIQSLNC